MNRPCLIALAAASALLTPVVVHATGAAPKASAPASVASTAAAAPAFEDAPASCLRKIKVVYGSYGEGNATACAVR